MIEAKAQALHEKVESTNKNQRDLQVTVSKGSYVAPGFGPGWRVFLLSPFVIAGIILFIFTGLLFFLTGSQSSVTLPVKLSFAGSILMILLGIGLLKDTRWRSRLLYMGIFLISVPVILFAISVLGFIIITMLDPSAFTF